MDENPVLYELTAFDNQSKQATAQRIYDNNAILLINEDNRNTRYMSVEEILDQMHIMEEEEEKGVRQEMQNERHIITIKYQVEDFGDQLGKVLVNISTNKFYSMLPSLNQPNLHLF